MTMHLNLLLKNYLQLILVCLLGFVAPFTGIFHDRADLPQWFQ